MHPCILANVEAKPLRCGARAKGDAPRCTRNLPNINTTQMTGSAMSRPFMVACTHLFRRLPTQLRQQTALKTSSYLNELIASKKYHSGNVTGGIHSGWSQPQAQTLVPFVVEQTVRKDIHLSPRNIAHSWQAQPYRQRRLITRSSFLLTSGQRRALLRHLLASSQGANHMSQWHCKDFCPLNA